MDSKRTGAADLVRRASQGDAHAVADLLERHLPDLHRYVDLRTGARIRSRESRADVVQSVCREALEELGDFEYRGEGQFRNWLFRLAYRKIVDKDRFHRAKRRDVAREEAPRHDTAHGVDERFIDRASPSRIAIGNETERALAEAFVDLPDENREAILLTRVVGLTHEEAAREMKRSVGSVRMLVYRGIAKIGRKIDTQLSD